MPRPKKCQHTWKSETTRYANSPEGHERFEFLKFCSKCFEERHHYYIQFEDREGLQDVARKFKTMPNDWYKVSYDNEEGC